MVFALPLVFLIVFIFYFLQFKRVKMCHKQFVKSLSKILTVSYWIELYFFLWIVNSYTCWTPFVDKSMYTQNTGSNTSSLVDIEEFAQGNMHLFLLFVLKHNKTTITTRIQEHRSHVFYSATLKQLINVKGFKTFYSRC